MKRLAGGGRGAWTVVALTVTGGCTAILGIDPEYHLVDGGGAGGATSAAATSTTATGATATSTTATGATATTTTSGGGGAGGPASSSATSSTGAGGVCAPLTDRRCVSNLPQSCDASGQWHDDAACSAQTPVCIAGTCGAPPSCVGLLSTCGPGHDESCCASPIVPEGTFNRGNDPGYPATVSDFRLDRFEITVGRFRQFVAGYPANTPAAGAGAHPLLPGSGWQTGWNAYLAADQPALRAEVKCSAEQTWTDSVGANEHRPMNCLTWHEAFAFCAWDGGRLPTEAEWGHAAAGGGEQRPYPWGAQAPDAGYAVYDCTGDGSSAGQCAPNDILDVGSRSTLGDGRWKQADLGGGVWEWNLDWYVQPFATSSCVDCANLTQGNATSRLIQGGAWDIDASYLPTYFRGKNKPTDHSRGFGARCARMP